MNSVAVLVCCCCFFVCAAFIGLYALDPYAIAAIHELVAFIFVPLKHYQRSTQRAKECEFRELPSMWSYTLQGMH